MISASIKKCVQLIVVVTAAIRGSLMSAPAPAARAAALQYDGWFVATTNGCGQADFVDYGPGLPGGGSNDDYVMITDYCADHHGVKAWAWLTRNGTKYYLGSADPYGSIYDDNPTEIWDPFKAYGNVKNGDYVGLKVCLVDGTNDPTPSDCASETEVSDG